jgi:acetylornithine deacetylase/succinyl-diaminopimelate desuccinylase-like protein
MSSARSGEQASNVIPATATAGIDMRLVKGISPDQARSRVIDHIRKNP